MSPLAPSHPLLARTHPKQNTKQFGYKAVASGAKEEEAMSALEKMVKEKEEEVGKDEKGKQKEVKMNESDTVMSAIQTLQKVLGVDFKSNQVEVGIVTVKNPRFRLLKEKEIDE